jgi:ABC-type multidrug transport system ATPase subunit
VTSPLVDVRALEIHDGPIRVLDSVDLVVAPERVAAVVGPAGSGKSLLLAALIGAAPIASGTARIAGHDVATERRAALAHTTWVAGSGPLEPHLTVRQNVALLLKLASHAGVTDVETERALRRSEVRDRLFHEPAEFLTARETLSVWLTIARLRNTPVVLLDEPAGRLTPAESLRAAELIRELAAEGCAIVVATRELGFAELVANDLWLLDSGRLSPFRVTESV